MRTRNSSPLSVLEAAEYDHKLPALMLSQAFDWNSEGAPALVPILFVPRNESPKL